MEVNKVAILLSLMQAIQMGIKRHLNQAEIHAPKLDGTDLHATFTVMALGHQWEITIRLKNGIGQQAQEK